MRTIIKQKTSKFTFTSYFPSGVCGCIMTIKMTHYSVSDDLGKLSYELIYNYEFPESYSGNVGRTGLDNPAHPFYQTKCEQSGVIISHNKMVETMLEYLFMDDESLEIESGLKTAASYRASILLALDRFWD